jgi:hypothetical protein
VNGGFEEDQAATIFSNVDVDNDGYVTYQEITAHVNELKKKNFSS